MGCLCKVVMGFEKVKSGQHVRWSDHDSYGLSRNPELQFVKTAL